MAVYYNVYNSKVKSREQFVRGYATGVYHREIQGNVAEAGAFQGEFATVINYSFPESAEGITEEFVYVDLYMQTIEGVCFSIR